MTTILIVDDVPDVLENAGDLLELEGYDVLRANDGIEGIDIAREHQPDLIICDVNMPGLNGYDVIEALRSDITTATIPFIFLSANTLPEHIRMGMVYGADDYVTKPFTRDQLISRVQSRLKRHELYELERIRSFAHQVVAIQESERQSLSYNLKDNLAGILLDLKLTLGLVERLPDHLRQPTLQTSQELLDEVLRQIDNFSHALYPTTLNQLGVLVSIYFLIDQFRDRSGMQTVFEHQGLDELELDNNIKIALYRIVQEALTNVEKHSKAQHVDVRIWVEDEEIRLQIIDDGKGFVLDEVLQDHDSVGIIGIRERIFLLSGEFSVSTAPDEGTQIIGSFPLSTDGHLRQMKLPNPPSRRNDFKVQLPQLEHYTKPSQTNQLQVVIAESNELTQWGLENAVNSDGDFCVCDMTDNIEELNHILTSKPVDIVIVSHTLNDNSETHAIVEQLHGNFPDVKLIVLSNYSEFGYAKETLSRGASGYLLKSSSLDEIVIALHAVARGKQHIAEDAITTISTTSHTSINGGKNLDAFSTLTDREREIFYLVINGNSNKGIAEQLVISPRTAETHRRNMMQKLGLRGTQQLMRFAMDRGLIGG